MLNSLITLLWMGSPDTWFKLSHFKVFFFIYLCIYVCVYLCVQSVKYSYRLFCWPFVNNSFSVKHVFCLKKNKNNWKYSEIYIIWWRQGVLYEEDYLTFSFASVDSEYIVRLFIWKAESHLFTNSWSIWAVGFIKI